MPSNLKVGSYKINITPPLDQSRRVGPDGLATDIVVDFYARATVFDDGISKAAVVLLDLCEFYCNITQRIRRLACRYTDIPQENILVCATHVHAAPSVIDEHDASADKELSVNMDAYLNVLCRKAANAVYMANSRLLPAKAGIGEISLQGIGRPSRIFLKDNSIISLGSTVGIKDISPDEIESESMFDDVLRMTVFKDYKDKPICALANFGCHNNIALHTTSLNSDFFGYAMCKMEEELGSGFVMSVTAGTVGDVQPLAQIEYRTYNPDTGKAIPPGRGDNMIYEPGEILYHGIRQVLDNNKAFETDEVIAANEYACFPWRKPLSAVQSGYIKSREAAGGKQDENGGTAELQAVRIGDMVLLAICGEVFNEIGAKLRKLSPFKHTWTVSLANDMLVYLLPGWEHDRESLSYRKSYQNQNCITDRSAESIIYESYKKLFSRLKR